MMDVARDAMPGTAIKEATWLHSRDNYYRSRGSFPALPALRVSYADADSTWLYFDPNHGTIAQKQDRVTRARRWLYNGLHSFDFPYLYDNRVLRDILIYRCFSRFRWASHSLR
jgi:hypothetical protein